MRTIVFSLFCLIGVQVVADERPKPVLVEYSAEQLAMAKKIKHFIVIYQENWSFDSLYGNFPGVNGLKNAPAKSYQQVDRAGKIFTSLPPSIDTKTKKPYPQIPTKLPNAPFNLEPLISMKQMTGDLFHEFYQEQTQINNGMMNRFANISDAAGFVMSYYDISQTRIGKITQSYTVCDNFFHSCYGGSMCSVLWLFTARMPLWPNAPKSLIAKVGPDGIVIKDGLASTDGYAINDAEPFYPPYRPGTKEQDRVPPQTYKTIGDLLSENEVSWGWYAQGWDEALTGKDDPSFAYHHQAPSYFTQFAPGTKARKEHLFDLNQFYKHLDEGTLPAVCFIRSLYPLSEHPGHSALLPGLEWSADIIEKIQKSSAWKDCAIILTYDENGGRWDHVTPPVVDEFGPGTRIPAAIISPFAKKNFVDHTCYETVSILKFIEQRWGLEPLSTRDAQANNLLNAFEFGN